MLSNLSTACRDSRESHYAALQSAMTQNAMTVSKRALVRRVLQKLAMSSAEVMVATVLLQKDSKASFSALWNRELLLKLSTTYCTQHSTSQPLIGMGGRSFGCQGHHK
jgi:hypothetical protein